MNDLQIYRDKVKLVSSEGLNRVQQRKRNAIATSLSFRKKDFVFVQRAMNSTWDGFYRKYYKRPVIVDGKKTYPGDGDYFSTGLLQSVVGDWGVIEGISISDHRNIPKIEIDATRASYASLRPYQREALESLLFNEEMGIHIPRGILWLPPRTGKTRIAIAIIDQLRQARPAVFIVERVDLARQTVDAMEAVLGARIGLVGDGECDIRDITVITVQSLHYALGVKYEYSKGESKEKKVTKYDVVRDLVKNCEVLGVDECVDGNSDILTSDGYIKAIDLYGIVKSGESKYAMSYHKNGLEKYPIISASRLKRNGVTLSLQNGMELKCSTNHRVAVYKEDGIKWKSAIDLNKDDYILSLMDGKLSSDHSDDWWYFVGLFTGDGHWSKVKGHQCIQFGIRKDADWFTSTLKKLSYLLDVKYSDIRVKRGDTIIRLVRKGNDDHLFNKLWDLGFRPGKKTGSIPVPVEIMTAKPSEMRGWIQGLYDAEGSTQKDRIVISMTDRCIINAVQLILFRFGIQSQLVERIFENDKYNNTYQLSITGLDIKLFIDRIGFRMPRKNKVIRKANRNTNGIDAELIKGKLRSIGVESSAMCKYDRMSNKRIGREHTLLMLNGLKDELRNLSTTDLPAIKKLLAVNCHSFSKTLPLNGKTRWAVYMKTRYELKKHGNAPLFKFAQEMRGAALKAIESMQEIFSSFWVTTLKSKVEYKSDYFYDFGVKERKSFIANGVLVHNCHHVSNNSYQNAIKQAKNAWCVFGLSGTPWMDDGSGLLLKNAIGDIVFHRDYSYMVNNGYLCPLDVIFYKIPGVLCYSGSYMAVYKAAVTDNPMKIYAVVKLAKAAMRKGKSVAILTTQIKHTHKIVSQIPGSLAITGKERGKQRQEMFRQLESKDTMCIVSNCFNEGIDIPTLDVAINADGGIDSRRIFQRLRIMTPSPGKTKGVYIDFLHEEKHLQKHSLIRFDFYNKEPAFTVRVKDIRDKLRRKFGDKVSLLWNV